MEKEIQIPLNIGEDNIMQIKTTMNCHFSDWQKLKVLVVYCVGKDVGKLALGYITLLMEI